MSFLPTFPGSSAPDKCFLLFLCFRMFQFCPGSQRLILSDLQLKVDSSFLSWIILCFFLGPGRLLWGHIVEWCLSPLGKAFFSLAGNVHFPPLLEGVFTMCLGIDLWVYPVWSLFSFLHLQVFGGVCAKFGEFLVMKECFSSLQSLSASMLGEILHSSVDCQWPFSCGTSFGSLKLKGPSGT